MNMATKKDIFQTHLTEWLKVKGDKKKRGDITRHICFVTGMHPRSVPRKFKRLQLRDPAHKEKRGRSEYYTPDVTAALKDVWETGDEACGELLHPMIREYVEIMRRDGQWHHGEEATGKLLAMSERTVKRRVAGFMKIRGKRHGLTATKPSELKRIIPIFKGPWDSLPPGHGQIDTVAHCGDTLAGNMIYTVNYTDAATYWVIPRAQWNKGQESTAESMRGIRKLLPFSLLGLHPDTGSEFINWHLKGWCEQEHIDLSRSEPYKKNDNMYVEERNGHVVRRYIGWQRLDRHDVIPILNELYDMLVLYLNHFKAVRRTVSKGKVGSRYVRRYEISAKTPYRRVVEHPAVPHAVKQKLSLEHEALNPLLLKRKIDTLKTKVFTIQKRGHGSPYPT